MPLGATDISMKQIAASGSLGSSNISLQTIYTTYINGDATGDFGLDDMANKDYPTVTTNAASSVTSTSMTCNGNVSSDGGILEGITQRGFYFGTSTNYASNTKVSVSGTTGAYTLARTGLNGSTTYYITAYAINALGERQGSTVTQATAAGLTSFQMLVDIDTGGGFGSNTAACNADGETSTQVTRYHNGSAALPVVGDDVYTTSSGTTEISNCTYKFAAQNSRFTYNAGAVSDVTSCGKSQRKLKRNIKFIKKSPSGIPIYHFNYKNELNGKGRFIGTMVEDLQKLGLHEVLFEENGEIWVNYDMIDVDFKSIDD